jgi:excisionase family DNA binding protein
MTRLRYLEAAAYLAIPDGTLRSMVSRCLIPFVRLSPRVVVFEREALDQWLAERRQAALTREAFAQVRAARKAKR